MSSTLRLVVECSVLSFFSLCLILSHALSTGTDVNTETTLRDIIVSS